jgi:homospermidine synthase
MKQFNGKLLVIGCGSVAQCALPLILKLLPIPANKITILDQVDNKARIKEVIDAGVQYVIEKLTPENYATVFKKLLSSGDICIDLACNIETTDLMSWCHDAGVMYINTAVEEWNPFEESTHTDRRELTLYARQMEIRKMISSWPKKSPTAVVDHGANPGLVSHFTKQALIDISKKIIAEKPKDPRVPKLEAALANKQFAHLAQLCNVQVIHISERDTQITSKPKQVNEFVNTWSVEGFIEEGSAPAELGWGTHERTLPKGALTHEKGGPQNQICLENKGVNTWVKSWVPSGPIIGMVVRHGEAFSMSDYLTVWEKDKAVYRPTVHYAYCPADAAFNSLHEFKMRGYVPQEKWRILNNEIIDGKDELGCLLMGHDFGAWWIGSLLDIHEARRLVPGQSATTVQVAISLVAAVAYMLENPTLGYCLPDALDHEKILAIAKPFLGPFVSEQVDWNPGMIPAGSLDYQKKKIDPRDLWQFESFLTQG